MGRRSLGARASRPHLVDLGNSDSVRALAGYALAGRAFGVSSWTRRAGGPLTGGRLPVLVRPRFGVVGGGAGIRTGSPARTEWEMGEGHPLSPSLSGWFSPTFAVFRIRSFGPSSGAIHRSLCRRDSSSRIECVPCEFVPSIRRDVLASHAPCVPCVRVLAQLREPVS